jgi:hypothetical protein
MEIKNIILILMLIHCSKAENIEKLSYEDEARLAYYTTTGDGASFMTFNGTSMQNLVVLGVIIVVLGSLLLPYFGISNGILGIFGEESNTNKNDFQGIPVINTGIGYGGYQGLNRRSGETGEPVLKAVMKGQHNYES